MLPCCASHRLVETVQQQTAIRKAGQLIVICELAHLHHGLAQQGNVFLKKRPLFLELIDQSKRSSQLLLAGRQGAAECYGVRSASAARCRAGSEAALAASWAVLSGRCAPGRPPTAACSQLFKVPSSSAHCPGSKQKPPPPGDGRNNMQRYRRPRFGVCALTHATP